MNNVVFLRKRGAAAPAFTPADLATVDGWYNELGKSVDGDGNLTQWNDQSGNSRHLTPFLPGSTQFSSGHKFNGLDGVHTRGNHAGSYLVNGWTPTNNQSLFIAVRVRRDWLLTTGGSTLRPVVSTGSSGLSLGTGNSPTTAAQNVVRTYDGSNVRSSANDTFAPGEACTLIMQYDYNGGSPTITVYKDGVQVIAPVSAVTNPYGAMVVGRDLGHPTRFWEGYIFEIVVGQMVLSAGEIANLTTYLSRWDSGRTATVIRGWSGATQLITDAGAGQGVSSGNGFIFTTASSTNQLIEWFEDSTFTSQGSLDCTSFNGGAHTQVNGQFFNPTTNKLYVGANNFATTPELGWIYIFDFDPAGNSGAGTLTFDQAVSVAGNHCEGCAEMSDGTFMVCYHDVNRVDHYSSSFVLLNQITLPDRFGTSSFFYQGPAVKDDVIYMNYHGNAGVNFNFMVGFKYEAGSLHEATARLDVMSTDCRQGVFNDGTDFLAAQRTANNNNSNNHVVRATPLTYLADVG